MFSIRALLMLLSIALVTRLIGLVIRTVLFAVKSVVSLLFGAVRCFV